MIKHKIEAILSEVSDVLPANLQHLKQDVEKNLRATLNATFSNMELVTREEFDIQTALLQRTRAKLEKLEKLISELEQEIKKD